MDPWGYVLVGWAVTTAVAVAAATRTLTQGRRLTRQLPPEERRWM
jgi:hypothetical protein